MIFNILLTIFIQPLISSVFFFLAPVLNYFFQNKIKELFLSAIVLSLLTDIVFIKPLGFFLFIASCSLVVISIFERFFGYNYFYQKIIFLIVFNCCFLLLFFYFSSYLFFNFVFVLNFLIINLLFQLIYFFIKNFF
jgi:hypothetical protein